MIAPSRRLFCKKWLELLVDSRGGTKKPRYTVLRLIPSPHEATGVCNKPPHMTVLKIKRNAVIDGISSTMRYSCVGSRGLGQSLQTVEAAVDHEWFAMRADVAAIAIHETGDVRSRGEEQAKSDEESNQFLRDLFGSGG